MNGSMLWLVVGAAGTLAATFVAVRLFMLLTTRVAEGEAVVITRFGKLHEVLRKPGLHLHASRLFPWEKETHVSLRRDFRHVRDVHVNDTRGTTLVVDLWVELEVIDPEKALFAVADWDHALTNLVVHAATSILGAREFEHILTDRTELADTLKHEVETECSRWGVRIVNVFLRKVSVLPDVASQLYAAVAARLERARAAVDEEARLAVAKLDADTSVAIARLVAEAKGQYPEAVGRSLSRLGKTPDLLAAYNELYRLSLVRPHRTISFRGFGDGEIRAVDALMAAPLGPDPGTLALEPAGHLSALNDGNPGGLAPGNGPSR
jgi:regulator of protease activity HflC (stomatin/prohibitin superfamily)